MQSLWKSILAAPAATCIIASAAWAAMPELPVPQPQKRGDVQFLTGGVGKSERAAIEKEAGAYDLWLTVAERDGAYLSDVDVRIENDKGQVVLDTRTDGPFLLARLAPGRYSVRALSGGVRAGLRTVDVPEKGQNRIFMTLNERS